MSGQDELKFLDVFGDISDDLVEPAIREWYESGKRRGSRITGRAACIGLVMLLGLGCVFHSQVQAAFQKLTTLIGRALDSSEDLEPYTKILGTTQTKRGVSITLKEVILGENQLLAYVDVETEEKDALCAVGNGSDIKINGKEIHCTGIGIYSSEEGLEKQTGRVLEWDFPGEKIPESADIELEVTGYIANEEGEAEDEIRHFIFAFHASREELQKNTVNLNVDRKIQLENGQELKIKKLSFNSVYSSIEAECGYLPTESAEYLLKGTDNRGNTYYYELAAIYDSECYFKTNYFLEENNAPVRECQWMDLQLMKAEILPAEKEESVRTDASEDSSLRDAEFGEEMEEKVDGWEDKFKEEITDTVAITGEMLLPVGEKIRITFF